MTDLATKVSKTIFCYHLIGFKMNIVYDKKNQQILLTDVDSGQIIKVVAQGDDLIFEDFVLISQNILMDLIEMSN